MLRKIQKEQGIIGSNYPQDISLCSKGEQGKRTKLLVKGISYLNALRWKLLSLEKDIREALKEEKFQRNELEEEIDAVFILALLRQEKIRKEIREVLLEEGYQGNDLKAKLEEVVKQELLRQEKIRPRELEQAKERRALELKSINQAKSSEEKIRLCKQYIYEIQRERKLKERFSELDHGESKELNLIKEIDSQYVGELSKEEEEDAEIEDEEIEEERRKR